MPDYTLMDEFESEVNDVVEELWAEYNDDAELLGDRPYGYLQGDRWQQAAQYLDLRDDSTAWEQQIVEWAGSMGRETAEIVAISEATRMEKLIAEMGGYEAVRLGIFARRLRAVEPGMERARKILEAPKAVMLAPLPPMTDLDLLTRFTSLGEGEVA